jgi:gluconate 2-dehydrogenase gamma chain
MRERTRDSTRRGFLGKAAALAAGIPLVGRLLSAADSAVPAPGYRSLNRDEAAFSEAMVTAMCPADHLTPDGATCGLAKSLDSQIGADPFFKAGIHAADRACQDRLGRRFHQLSAEEARLFLHDIAGACVGNQDFPLTLWFNKLVEPAVIQASFAGPIYHGYSNRVFWKLVG